MFALRHIVALLVFHGIAAASIAGDPANLSRAQWGKQYRPEPVTDDMRSAARSANAFAFDLYGQLEGRDGNQFFSPSELWSLLAMAAAGAKGETERQMLEVLHAELPQERRLAACGKLMAYRDVPGDGVTLKRATRIFTAPNNHPLRPYLATVKDASDALPTRLNFANPRRAARAINQWIARNTGGKITNLVSPRMLPRDTQLLLASASHFDAKWEKPFGQSETRDEPFRPAGGEHVTVSMMHQTDTFRYGESDGLQLVELPYSGGDFAMVILLPKVVGLEDLESSLTAEALEQWTSAMKEREVILSVPKFRTDFRAELTEMLIEMGMPLAFSENADFSRMTPRRGARIVAVAHAGSIAVDEVRTVAATATVVGGLGGGGFGPEPPVEFRADRPFVYLVRDVRTGLILYLGRVIDPTK